MIRPQPNTMSITYWFTREDVLRTRFAISPLFETAASLTALQEPGRSSIHLPWIHQARDRTRGLELDLLFALVPAHGYAPDFVSPPPSTALPDIEQELSRIPQTAPAQVRKELEWTYPGGLPEVLRRLHERPRRELPRVVESMRAYWHAAIEPFWERIAAALEDDIAHRARLLTGGGPIEVFGDLHPEVRWAEGALVVDREYEGSVELQGRGLLLAPSVFIWPRAGAFTDRPWQPTLIYPPRGVGGLWAPDRRDPQALADLLGSRRAAILTTMDREVTTRELARRLKASPAGVSEHLGVLRRAGLVRPRRQGASVYYARTTAGDRLVTAPASAPGSPS